MSSPRTSTRSARASADDDVGEPVAALVVDRHHVRGQLADLAAGHAAGHGQRAGGQVEVLRRLPGHQPHLHLVPRRPGADPDHAGYLVAAGLDLGATAVRAERGDLHGDGLAGVGDGEVAGA